MIKPPSKLEARLEKIKSQNYPRIGVWEVDYGDEPISARFGSKTENLSLFLAVHCESFFIICSQVEPEVNLQTFCASLLDGIEKINALPDEIAVKKSDVADALSVLASPLGIKVSI